MCKREFLNYLRVREWQDYESQLRQVCKEMKIQLGRPADVPDADGIHQALLSGLLSHIGLLEERDKKDSGGDGAASASTSAPAARGSRSSRAAGSRGRTRRSSWPASSSRPAGCGRARTPRSSPSGPSGSAPTW